MVRRGGTARRGAESLTTKDIRSPSALDPPPLYSPLCSPHGVLGFVREGCERDNRLRALDGARPHTVGNIGGSHLGVGGVEALGARGARIDRDLAWGVGSRVYGLGFMVSGLKFRV
jgi:hypothetical protein